MLCDLLAAGRGPVEGPDGEALRTLLDRIHERSGVDFGSYKPATILRRIRGRMNATSCPTLAEYAARVESDPEEYARLLNSLLIKVTDFFRDPKLFEYLRERVLPELIAQARTEQRELRIWSAGCATGEEAYSLAIAVAETLGDAAWPEVRIFATDIDRQAVAFARRATYSAAALRGLPAGYRDRYFAKSAGGYEVVKRLRAMMVFGEHDLGERAPFPRIDLLLCRNVLIYFAAPMQRIALETFAFSLRPGGRLVLGTSESVLALAEPFEDEQVRLRVFRRLPGNYAIAPMRPARLRGARIGESSLDQAIRGTHREVQRAAAAGGSADSLLLNLTVGVVVVDARYYIVRINSAARQMLGIHGAAFDQDFVHLAEVLPPAAIRAAIDSALEGRTTSKVFEVEPTDAASETTRFVQVTVRPYRVESQSIAGAVIELTDATRLEHERVGGARTHERLEKAIATNGRLLRANEELTSLVSELRGANETMLLASEDAQATREEVETINEEFQATNEELETLNEELTASVEELRVANEDLATRTDELSAKTASLEQQRLSSEEEHDRLRSILASLGDAIVAVDHEGRIVMTNGSYDRLFGGVAAEFAPEDAAGLPIQPSELPQMRAARGERFRSEFAISQPGGERRWFEAVAEPLKAQDRTWGGVVAIRDISERTMRQSLERLMASAGHELKTPVVAMHGYVQLIEKLLGPNSSPEARHYLAGAVAQNRSIGQLIDRLFDVSRIKAGRFELDKAPVDLDAILRRAVEVAEMLPKVPPIRLSPVGGPLPLEADAGRLEQVFGNILANAAEHAAASSTIDVSVHRSGSRAVVAIRDHGPGIEADMMPRLFQPYAQLGKKRSAGLGLGLYLAREIVTAHGGTIEAQSTVGEGTAITVELPLVDARTRRATRRSPKAHP